MCRQGLFCKRIEFSGLRIVLNGRVEPIGVKHSNHARKRASSRGSNCSTAFSMSSVVVI
jgi:hypothetical protein